MSSCIRVCDRRDKNTNSQINNLIKYISNTRGGVMQNESIATRMVNIYFRVCVRLFNR